MSTAVISCRTIEAEVRSAMAQAGCRAEVRWLESGLHNVPKLLNARLQELLDQCTDAGSVLLAMSFCGNAAAGLRTGEFQLVIPRCDDCITLLLGSAERRAGISATYFLTEGWLKGERSIRAEYEACLKKYGEKRGKHIFSVMFAHYRNLALLDTGCCDLPPTEAEIRRIAETLGLRYVSIPGTLDYLKALFTGDWSGGRFTVIPPHSTVPASGCAFDGQGGCQ